MAAIPAEPPPGIRPGSLWLALLLVGACWGSTQLVSKVVVEHGQPPLGVALAASVIGALITTGLVLARGRPLPLGRRHLVFYAICGLTGTALPNSLSYTAMRELPVGVMAIVLSIVPIMTFVGALVLRMDRADPRRLFGLLCGATAVLLLVAPAASLPEPGDAIWIVLPVLTGVAYTAEGLYIARHQPPGLGALRTLCGLTWAAVLMLIPVVATTGTWVRLDMPGLPELALMSCLNVAAYAGYVWLVGRGGPVFASQVGYVVTLSGVFLGMTVLGERHSVWVWLSLALMLAGLSLVSPRRRSAGFAAPAPAWQARDQ